MNSNNFYVSPYGNDTNCGDKANPFATVEKAINFIKENKGSINGDVNIILKNGNYFLKKTLEINKDLNLLGGHTLFIKADEGATPVISGGKQIKSFEKTYLNGISLYRAKVEEKDFIRSLFVNGKERNLASKFREKKDRKYWGWMPGTEKTSFEVRFADFGKINNPKQLEVVWHSEWKTFIYRAESIGADKVTNSCLYNSNIINMKQPYFSYITSIIEKGMLTEHDPNGYWWPNPARHPLYLQNDINFIQNPGDFCFDEENKYLYYYPLEGEKISELEIIVSGLDEIIKICGKSEKPERVCNITFDGITFSHGAFSMIGKTGIGINQAQCYYSGKAEIVNSRLSIPYGQYEGNININYAENINFFNCTVKNTDGGGIYFHNGVKGGTVKGCVFDYIGDSAIIMGDGCYGFCPEKDMTQDIVIDNNLIRRTGRIIHSATAIQGYFVRNLTVIHNDIYDTPYSAIAIGWGWTVCLESKYTQNINIEYNRVGNFNNQVRDGGGIYTLGQAPNSFCRYNYIYEQMEAFGGLYHDEGSAYYTTTDNVVDNNTRLFDSEQNWLWINGFNNGPNGCVSCYHLDVHDNYTTNKRESVRCEKTNSKVYNNYFIEQGNMPKKAIDIINNAGLEEKYKNLFNKL